VRDAGAVAYNLLVSQENRDTPTGVAPVTEAPAAVVAAPAAEPDAADSSQTPTV